MGLLDFLGDLFGRGSGSASARWTDGESADPDGDRPVEFTEAAETFAGQHPDREFDFTVASLDRLDEFVATTLTDERDGGADTQRDLPDDPALSVGCYFGEVLVRAFDGEWIDRGDVTVTVPAGATSVAVPPFDAARRALRGDPRFARTAAAIGERVGDGDADPGLALDLGAGAGDDPAAETAAAVDGAGATDSVGGVGTTEDPTAENRPDDPTDADVAFPTVDLDAGMDLDAAHERTLAAFESAGYSVTAGDLLNSMPENPVEGVGKLFLFYSATEMYTGVVYVGDWSESDAAAVVSLARYLRSDEDLDGLHVVSAVALPPAVTYLATTHPRAAFALDARDERTDRAFTAESAPAFADLGADLLDRHVDVRLDRTDTGSLARLDGVVLDELRPLPDHGGRYDGYVPREALLALGALAGEVMRHGLERELPVAVEWGTDEEIASTGVVLQITTEGADGSLTVNPVGKAFKLFRSGESERLADLHERCLRVTEREVADLGPVRGDD
jgi:hypothetical protein